MGNVTTTFSGVRSSNEALDEEIKYGENSVDTFDHDAPSSHPFLSSLKAKFLASFKYLYGEVPEEEIVRTLFLSLPLFFLLSTYWLLRSLKDPVLTTISGVQAIPKAKMLSVIVVLCVVAIYNRLLDIYERHRLFYLFGSIYIVLFTGIAVALASPIGLEDKNQSESRILGWVSYCTIESFGSLMISLFWSSPTPPPRRTSRRRPTVSSSRWRRWGRSWGQPSSG